MSMMVQEEAYVFGKKNNFNQESNMSVLEAVDILRGIQVREKEIFKHADIARALEIALSCIKRVQKLNDRKTEFAEIINVYDGNGGYVSFCVETVEQKELLEKISLILLKEANQ